MQIAIIVCVVVVDNIHLGKSESSTRSPSNDDLIGVQVPLACARIPPCEEGGLLHLQVSVLF